jgi:serine phosphatase RsbU (regulator of sigma subunit)
MRSCCGYTPAQIDVRIIHEVSAFAGGGAQGDDMTLVVVGLKDEEAIQSRQ